MKYALLIYASPGGAEGAKSIDGVYDNWFDYTAALRDSGALLTAGPFMETKEHLGGFYLIDVPDLDTALDWAAKMPIMRYGTVEVRPVREGQAWQAGLR